MTGQPDELLSLRQVAAELGISYRKVQKLVADGTLPHYKMGTNHRAGYRIGRSDLDYYRDQLRRRAEES